MRSISVMEMGKARERRKITQELLLKKYNLPVISFTLNIPGPEKDSPLYRKIHALGINKIEQLFRLEIVGTLINQYHTGSEAFFTVDLPPVRIKEKTIELEENTVVGRVFDIDVLRTDGSAISRTDINRKPRKCLLCDETAALCSRNRTHTVEELVLEIERLTNYLYDSLLR